MLKFLQNQIKDSKIITILSKFLQKKGAEKEVVAEADPTKAPETANAIKQHVAAYGPEMMSREVGRLNTRQKSGHRREKAIGRQIVRGMTIDEEPPASFREQGEPVTTRVTPQEEEHHQGGVIGAAERKAAKMGPNTTITQSIKGEGLTKRPELGSAAQSAKERARKKEREQREAEEEADEDIPKAKKLKKGI